jgi:membrane protease YdiL (CAAX protease family)
MKQSRETPTGFYVTAFVFEIVAALLLISPLGSSLTDSRWAAGPGGALLIIATVAIWPWVVRLLPGPKPWRIFFRRGTPGPFRSIYYGFLAAALIVAYRVLLSVGLWGAGVPIENIVVGNDTPIGFLDFGRTVVVSAAVGIFFFGYIQGFAERLFGGRAGTLVTGVVFAFCAGFPLTDYGAGPGDLPRWAVFLVLHLPVGLALAYMRRRTRSSVATIAAVFFVAAAVGLGEGILTLLGWAPFLFATVITLLIAAEIVVGERRRLFRFYGGFGTEFFTLKGGDEEPASLLDGLLLTLVSAGLLFFIRAVDFFFYEWYITLPIGLGVFFVAEILWLVGRITAKGPAVVYETAETKDVTPGAVKKPGTPTPLTAAHGKADTEQASPDNGKNKGKPAEEDVS